LEKSISKKRTLTKKYEELHLRQAEIETNREDFDWQVEIFKSQVGEIEKRLMEIDDKIKDFKERRGKVEADEDMAWQTVALVEEYLKRGPENRPDEWCIAEEPCMSGTTPGN
jgi:chromosome segregation ATPase